MNNEILEKARKTAVKYVRRVPKPTGKGWYYFYTVQQYEHYKKTGDPGAQNNKPVGMFDAIKNFFGFGSPDEAKKKCVDDFKAHGIQAKFGIELSPWIMHVSEYFTNKEKWDSFFNRQAVPKEKSESSNVAESAGNTNADKGKKVKNGEKSFELGVMRYIFSTYHDIQPVAKGGQNEHRTNQSNIRPGKLSANSDKVLGGGDSRRTISDVPEKQPTDNGEKPIQSSVDVGIRPSGDVFVKVGKKKAQDIREQCRQLLETKTDDEMTEEDKALLRQYEGAGGLGEKDQSTHGVLSEFYTPTKVVSKVWDIVNKYTEGKGKLDVLEPSAGTGRFMESGDHNFDGVEIDSTSARINRILHPGAKIIEGAFQKLFFEENGRVRKKQYDGKQYDVIIGNPPYGAYDNEFKGLGEGKDHTRYEEYFIDRGLDTLKEGGIMAFVVPSAFMRNWNNSAIKEKIAGKGRLMEGWRLPNGTFSSTAVGTDILIIRKEKGNVNDFLGDDFFLKNPQNVVGDEVIGKDRFGKPEKYIQRKDGQTFDDALNSVDSTKHDVPPVGDKPMSQQQKDKISVGLEGNDNAKKQIKAEKKKKDVAVVTAPGETQSAEEFNAHYNRKIDKHEVDAWKATNHDGSIDVSSIAAKSLKILQDVGEIFKMGGKLYHKKNYASGNVYEKLAVLDQDKAAGNLTDAEYANQKAILEAIKPEIKTVKSITVSPLSQFAKDFEFHDESGTVTDSLINKFWYWAGVRPDRKQWQNFDSGVTKHDIPLNASWTDIVEYIEGAPVRADRGGDKVGNQVKAGKVREQRRDAAEKIFNRFIEQGLSDADRAELESKWNRRFNGNVDPDYTKIPVFVNGISKTFKDKPLDVKDIQLKGVAFLGNKGNGLLAYDVGVGKTLTGILATVQQLQLGRAKAPAICVPSAVYENWIAEIRELFPNIKINELGNLGKNYANKIPKKADGSFNLEGAINVMSYEALSNISFKDETINGPLFQDMVDSQESGNMSASDRDKAKEMESIKEKIGKASKVKTDVFFMEDLGIDHITIDEVHNAKNVFGGAKAQSKQVRGKDVQQANEFSNLTGGTSDRAMKTFAIAQYIQSQNNGKNVFALSATPFTNSPLEVYNILSLFARNRLKDLGIYNLHEFMAQFAKLKSEWAIKTDGVIERKSVMKDFQNLSALQNLIKEYIDKVDGDEAGVVRPDKTVHQIRLPMSELQELMMKAEQDRMADKSRENPAAAIVGINNTRVSTVSPLMVNLDEYHEKYGIAELVAAERKRGFVESSPKLEFVFGSVLAVHEKRPDVGQVVYMPIGTEYYKEGIAYLGKHGITADKIAVIDGDVSLKKRAAIMKEFNDPNGKIKVVIGSEAIKEGVNLNGNTAVLHNSLLGWNASETTQVEGRIYRQGNKQKKVHIAYPQIVNSIDASMYQKHDEKKSRFNALWSYKGDNLNVEDINHEELKFDLIQDPERRAKFKIDLEKEALQNNVKDYEINIETLSKFKGEYETMKDNNEYYRKKIAEFEPKVAEAKAELDAVKNVKEENYSPSAVRQAQYHFDDVNGDMKEYKKGEKKTRDRVSTIENTLKQMGNIKFESIDSEIATRIKEKQFIENDIKAIGEKYQEYVEREKRALIEQKSHKTPSVRESIRQFADHVVANLSQDQPMQKALYITGQVVTVKRLNSETGLFQYFRTVR